MNKITTALEKFFASVINVVFILLITFPFLFIYGFSLKWKFINIFAFLLYELILVFTKQKRDLGMMVIRSYWKKPFTNTRYIIFNIFYTLSFSTLFFYFAFPGDLLLINLLLIQLPFVIITKYTLHGYLSGMVTAK